MPTITPHATLANTYVLQFNLSSYTNIISPSYSYGTGDTVELDLNLKLSNNFNKEPFYELALFEGRFTGENSSGTASCGTWGDRVAFSQAGFRGESRKTFLTGCELEHGVLYFSPRMTKNSMFGEEYRNSSEWISTTFTLPESITTTPEITVIGNYGSSPTDYNTTTYPNKLNVALSGNTMILTPGPDFVNGSQRSNYAIKWYADVQGNCTTPELLNYDYTVKYKEYTYSDSPVDKEYTHTNYIDFTQPTYELQNLTPTVVDSGIANFDVQICNTSITEIDYNWFRVTPDAGLTITEVFDVTSGTDVSVNFYQSAGITYVELGSLGIDSATSCKNIRFKGTYENCNSQNVTIENAWDCSSYPGAAVDFEALDAMCYQESLTIPLQPIKAQSQIFITNQPNTSLDLCTSFNIGVDVVSAQFSDLLDPVVSFTIPGGATGITVNSVAVEYPKGSGNIEMLTAILTGDLVSVNLLDHSVIAANNGIYGTSNSADLNERTAYINYDLKLECDFITNSPLTFRVFGNSPCKEPALGNGARAITQVINVNNASKPYDAVTEITVPNSGEGFIGCSEDTFSFKTIIVGGTTSTEDFGLIVLPDNLNYVSSLFCRCWC